MRKGEAVSNYTVKQIDEMEAIYNDSFKRAGAELGVESFGLQVFDMPAGFDQYPEHDHAEDGQEEVYVVLRGSGEWEIDGVRVPVDSERIVRIAAGTKRRLWPGPQGIRILALGGVPGKLYERPEPFKLGAPDPTAAA
jgi:mannose-6-phosphate isomerase-like protein (cupin superfamily)